MEKHNYVIVNNKQLYQDLVYLLLKDIRIWYVYFKHSVY